VQLFNTVRNVRAVCTQVAHDARMRAMSAPYLLFNISPAGPSVCVLGGGGVHRTCQAPPGPSSIWSVCLSVCCYTGYGRRTSKSTFALLTQVHTGCEELMVGVSQRQVVALMHVIQ
jgi:hypothetical protein